VTVALDAPETLASIESAKLQRHFGRFDILFFLICTIVGVDTIATVASSGGQAFTWMVILAVIFFVPQALLFAELGTAFPQEGGPYLWTRMAFGHLAGAVNNFLYWVTNPVWVGGTLAFSAVTAIQVFFNDGNDMSTLWFYVVSLIFIWLTVIAAIMSFSAGKWIPTAGAFARFALLGFFTLTVAIYAADHGVHGLGAGDYKPTGIGFVGLVAVLLFNYVGFELPSSAGEEMTNPTRDVPFAIARSAVGSFLLYAVPVLGILLVLPVSQVTGFGGFVDAIQRVFTVYGGHVAADGTPTLTGAGAFLGDLSAILFIICLLTSGITWIMGSDRAMAVSGYDGAAPRFLGVISEKYGTPVRVNVFTGIVGTIVLVLAHQITGGNAAKFFDAVLGVAISTTLISYVLIYPALWKLRKSHPEVERPYKMPYHRALTVLLMVLLAVTIIEIMFPGAGSSWFGSNYRPDGWNFNERWTYLGTELAPVVVFCLIGVAFWMAGAKTRREQEAATMLSAAIPAQVSMPDAPKPISD
jgi:glutamate:GABA antiporter